MEQPLDENYEFPVLPKEHSEVLFWISFLIFFTTIYAFSKQKYDISVICFLIFLTSINHWRDPRFGFRRNIDMVAVGLGFLYILVRAILLNIHSILFWVFYLVVVILYPLGWYVQGLGYIWESTYIHGLLHLCGNSAVVLFCGG